MSIFESVILGLIQGLTEFLPVSSSGHLIIAREMLGIPLEGSLYFDIFLNTATLFAVIFCFWGDLKDVAHDFWTREPSRRSQILVYAIVLGTIPAGLIGFFYGDQIENTFRSSLSVALALIVGSAIMFFADKIKKMGHGLTPAKGFLVGVFQTLALIPGISRSGSSISGGLFTGLSRKEAIRFSFLLLIPVSLGAFLKIILDADLENLGLLYFLSLESTFGFIAAFLSGVWAIRFLLRYLSHNSFTLFIIYRLLLAVIILIFI